MEYSTYCFFLFNPTGCTFLQHEIRDVKPEVVPPFFSPSVNSYQLTFCLRFPLWERDCFHNRGVHNVIRLLYSDDLSLSLCGSAFTFAGRETVNHSPTCFVHCFVLSGRG